MYISSLCNTSIAVFAYYQWNVKMLFLHLHVLLLISFLFFFSSLFSSALFSPSQGINENLWSVQYLLLFIVMGAIGGLLGAWFNSLNQHLTVYRLKHVFRKHISIKLVMCIRTVQMFV